MSDNMIHVLPYPVNLDGPIGKTFINKLFATNDNEAHRFELSLYRGEAETTIPDGATVTAYFIRYSDNATVTITGSATSNVVSVTLNKSCYNKAGAFAIIVKVQMDNVISTVFYGEGSMQISTTDTIVDPDNIIPSLEDLLAKIAVMEKATADANTATANANTATQSANNAAAKIEGMTVSAVKADEAGATISEVDGVKHIAFDLPKGDKGDKGDPGTIENVTITSIAGLEEALAGKLGTNETAANANQLNGKDASEYAMKTDLPTTAADVGALPSDGTAANANALNGNGAEYYATAEVVDQLSEKVAEATDSTPVSDASINGVSFQLFRCGKLAMVSLVSGQTSSQVAASGVFGALPDGFKPVLRVDFKDVYAEKRLWFDPDGTITAAGSDIAAGTILRGTITYVCA